MSGINTLITLGLKGSISQLLMLGLSAAPQPPAAPWWHLWRLKPQEITVRAKGRSVTRTIAVGRLSVFIKAVVSVAGASVMRLRATSARLGTFLLPPVPVRGSIEGATRATGKLAYWDVLQEVEDLLALDIGLEEEVQRLIREEVQRLIREVRP